MLSLQGIVLLLFDHQLHFKIHLTAVFNFLAQLTMPELFKMLFKLLSSLPKSTHWTKLNI
jgi:hypothetical protein